MRWPSTSTRLCAALVPRMYTPANCHGHGLRHLYARHAAQQINHAGGLQAVDVVAGEHGVGCAAVVARFDLTIGADQHVRQFQGLFAVEGVGQ